jgi:hypothetical protein
VKIGWIVVKGRRRIQEMANELVSLAVGGDEGRRAQGIRATTR